MAFGSKTRGPHGIHLVEGDFHVFACGKLVARVIAPPPASLRQGKVGVRTAERTLQVTPLLLEYYVSFHCNSAHFHV